ncbi:MAG TPA: OmpH family outer membrane protein [Pantanalinema sp.]
MLQRMVSGFAALALAAGLMLQAPAQAAAPGALGYVDTQKVFQSYKGAQSAQDRFRKEAQDYQEELVDAQRKLEEARKANKSSDEIAKMQKKFEDELKPKKAKVEALDRELSGKIKKQIEAAIAQVAKTRGFATVVDKAAILYGGEDLTGDVLKNLNK